MTIILGIDPGTTNNGIAVVEFYEDAATCLHTGVSVSTSKKPEEKVLKYHNDLVEILDKYSPSVCAYEHVTMNGKTGALIQQDMGILYLLCIQRNISIHPYTPSAIKLQVANSGVADKRQIQEAVKRYFSLDRIPKPDHAADALAAASTYILKSYGTLNGYTNKTVHTATAFTV